MSVFCVLASTLISFIVMSFLVIVSMAIVGSTGNKPTMLWIFVNLIQGAIAAIVGGLTAAQFPALFSYPVESCVLSVWGLSFFTGFMTLLTAATSLLSRQEQPFWYHFVLLFVSQIGIFYGASLALPLYFPPTYQQYWTALTRFSFPV